MFVHCSRFCPEFGKHPWGRSGGRDWDLMEGIVMEGSGKLRDCETESETLG